MTQPFCGDCTRARLSADGQLYTCLFAVRGHDLRALVRSGADDAELAAAIAAIWSRRTDRYSELRSANTADLPKIEMSYIGGLRPARLTESSDTDPVTQSDPSTGSDWP